MSQSAQETGTFHGRKLAVCSGVYQKRNTALEDELFEALPDRAPRAADGGRGPSVHYMGELKRVPTDLDGGLCG